MTLLYRIACLGLLAYLAARAGAAPAVLVTPPAVVRMPAGVAAAPAPAPPPPALTRVHAVEIDRAEVDRALADPTEAMRGARIVPSIRNGSPHGFKLYAIRPSSLLARLGFENGDTVLAVNGMRLDGPDHAIEAYTTLRDTDHLIVSLLRRGEPHAIVVIMR